MPFCHFADMSMVSFHRILYSIEILIHSSFSPFVFLSRNSAFLIYLSNWTMDCWIFKFTHFVITGFLYGTHAFYTLYFRNVRSSMNSRFNFKDVRFTTDNKYIVCMTFFSRNRSFFAFGVDNYPIVVEKFSTLFPIDAVFNVF